MNINKRWIVAVHTIISVIAITCFTSVYAAPPVSGFAYAPANLKIIDGSRGFTLEDQNGETQTYHFPRNRISVLLFADRDGSPQLEGWIRPLAERYGERIDIAGVAVLSAVPKLARPVVRRILRSKVKRSVMLDWSGTVSSDYGYEAGNATIVVLDRNGRMAIKVNGVTNQASLNRVYKTIDRLL